ncbi:MAG: hypothetical protein OEZ58_16530 [Gammaproteobacteria bacterium]|nr:hypothetical protein [Gammaproteobacteria bacterium]MDH5730598.1 hypothetical protein [Gammaproteobacteria bacterium]
MKQISHLFFAVSLLTLSACAGVATQGGTESADNHETAISKAETGLKALNAKGGAWRDTEELIKNAKQEVNDKNFDKALKLAHEALEQIEMANQQVTSEMKAAPWLF